MNIYDRPSQDSSFDLDHNNKDDDLQCHTVTPQGKLENSNDGNHTMVKANRFNRLRELLNAQIEMLERNRIFLNKNIISDCSNCNDKRTSDAGFDENVINEAVSQYIVDCVDSSRDCILPGVVHTQNTTLTEFHKYFHDIPLVANAKSY